MKIISSSGKIITGLYPDATSSYFLSHIQKMEEKYGIKFPKIDKVYVGNASFPVTTIKFIDGFELFDEIQSSPLWCEEENRKSINEWLKKNESAT
jgi:hypothetical protein